MRMHAWYSVHLHQSIDELRVNALDEERRECSGNVDALNNLRDATLSVGDLLRLEELVNFIRKLFCVSSAAVHNDSMKK
eukprot:m.26036 g.26036  ORF g.26036 m.26036 type:complete len:79 (-) comp9232_c0_seq1:2468-2704(-)